MPRRVSAGAIDVKSLRCGKRSRAIPESGAMAATRAESLDHEFVIGAFGRNKLKDRPNCSVGARVREREDEWTGLMRLAISGDSAAYHRLLKAVTPVLRAGGAPRAGAGGAAGRSIRGHRAGHFVGGASEAAYLGRQRAVRAVAVCDRPQQADRFAAPPRPPGFRQHRRFRRDDPERAGRGDRAGERGRGPAAVACRRASARCCSRSRSRAHRSRIRRRNSR